MEQALEFTKLFETLNIDEQPPSWRNLLQRKAPHFGSTHTFVIEK